MCHTENRLAGGLRSGENMVTRGASSKIHLGLCSRGKASRQGCQCGDEDRSAQGAQDKVCVEGLVLRMAVFCLLSFIACCCLWCDTLADRPGRGSTAGSVWLAADL